jgi:hypothetical protein
MSFRRVWNTVAILGGNILLRCFNRPPIAAAPVADDAGAALDAGRWDDVAEIYLGNRPVNLSPELRSRIESVMLGSAEGQQALAERPRLAGAILSAADPSALQDIDLANCFGAAKSAVMSEAALAVSRKFRPQGRETLDRTCDCDPDRFTLIARHIPLNDWNGSGAGIGAPRRGIGPAVCGQLWANGHYDQICQLIDLGVDTATSVPVTPGLNVKSRGGRVQPLQHILSPYLKAIEELPAVDDPLAAPADSAVEGARKILAALKAKGNTVTLTSYAAVTSCEMIEAFKKKPGTIWGFEEVRAPYVQAAHETDQGKEPLRMLELWEAVEPVVTCASTYDELLADPEAAIAKLVSAGRAVIEAGIAQGREKYLGIIGHEADYIAKFEQFASAFLREFSAQMPKGSLARPKLDDSGTPVRGATLSEAVGVTSGGLVGGLACKAGLWWAKAEGRPVYYCLDGVNMTDVTDYKKVKNRTIEAFIAKGGKQGGGETHNEGVTMVELREIIKNWTQLKDTIIFVEKGVILKDPDLTARMTQWQSDMQQANTAAGRAPAPPRRAFTGELNKIDPGLMARMPDGPAGDMDARDIVRKFGYLSRIANTRPEIALNYIMSRCGVLQTYGLIPPGLPAAAARLVNIDPDTPLGEVVDASAALKTELPRCHAELQRPLEAALLRHPLIIVAERALENEDFYQ